MVCESRGERSWARLLDCWLTEWGKFIYLFWLYPYQTWRFDGGAVRTAARRERRVLFGLGPVRSEVRIFSGWKFCSASLFLSLFLSPLLGGNVLSDISLALSSGVCGEKRSAAERLRDYYTLT